MTRERPLTADTRGQTQIDFAIGAGVFLVTLAFVVGFVPTLFEPFTAAESASPIVADRVAGVAVDLLGASSTPAGSLHAPTEPGVLSPACTVAFFDASLANETDCGFDDDALAEPFGLAEDVQVVVHELDETAPRENATTVDVRTANGSFENVTLTRSDADPDATVDDVTVSGRVVSLNGDAYRLTVRVWR